MSTVLTAFGTCVDYALLPALCANQVAESLKRIEPAHTNLNGAVLTSTTIALILLDPEHDDPVKSLLFIAAACAFYTYGWCRAIGWTPRLISREQARTRDTHENLDS